VAESSKTGLGAVVAVVVAVGVNVGVAVTVGTGVACVWAMAIPVSWTAAVPAEEVRTASMSTGVAPGSAPGWPHAVARMQIATKRRTLAMFFMYSYFLSPENDYRLTSTT